MTDIFKIKKRGRKGEGRAVKFKALMLPEDIIDELKLYKNCYSIRESTEKDMNGYPIPARVSFEQVFRFWLDNIESFDPDAYDEVQSIKKYRMEHPVSEVYDIDPFFYPVDEFTYHFDTDDGCVDAEFNGETFVCSEDYMDFKGRILEDMYNNNWPLINSSGYEFSLEQAHELCRRMKSLRKRQELK